MLLLHHSTNHYLLTACAIYKIYSFIFNKHSISVIVDSESVITGHQIYTHSYTGTIFLGWGGGDRRSSQRNRWSWKVATLPTAPRWHPFIWLNMQISTLYLVIFITVRTKEGRCLPSPLHTDTSLIQSLLLSQCSRWANHLAVFQLQYETLLFNYNLQISYSKKGAKINKSNK